MKKLENNVKLYLMGLILGGLALGSSSVLANTIMNSSDVTYKTTTVKETLDDLYGLTADDVWQKLYPVGSIYISTSNTSPETLFGGTWEEFGQGKTLIGVGSNGTTNYAIDSSGGSKTKTIAVANLPAHSHSINLNTNSTGSHTHTVTTDQKANVATGSVGNHQHSYTKGTGVGNTTLTASQMPSHYHEHRTMTIWKNAGTSWASGAEKVCLKIDSTTVSDNCAAFSDRVSGVNVTNNTGGGGAHNHPLNTATDNTGASGGHNHTVTIPALSGTTASTGSHAHSISGDTGNTGSGTALNTQDPYITVYMWKRTS